jgi:alkaline phosphatase D
MRKNNSEAIVLILSLLISIVGFSQSASPIVSGPMLGPVELRTAELWIQVSPTVKSAAVKYWKKGAVANAKTALYKGELGREFTTIKVSLTGLDFDTHYQYQFVIDGRATATTGDFKTQDLWQWRKPPPDFTLLTGSCAYFNEPAFDRPGKPYGGDSSIFETMAKEKAAFMLWLGDNWYTRETDYLSEWGMNYRPSRDRSLKVLQPFLKSMSHYAIWDDHDYGPNNADKSFVLKDASRKVFTNFWCNPSFGENGQGIYTKITYNDVEIFLLDDRWFRSSDDTPDSLNGYENFEKKMYGEQQMEWFKNAMRQSQTNKNISFRIVATGSQVLNPLSPIDCFRHFPAEFHGMMDFLDKEKINGVVFLTGDRHLSEINTINRKNNYPLSDITVSALTAGASKYAPEEANNPARVLSVVGQQNYARVSFTKEGPDRTMMVELVGIKGESLGVWSVALRDLTAK